MEPALPSPLPLSSGPVFVAQHSPDLGISAEAPTEGVAERSTEVPLFSSFATPPRSRLPLPVQYPPESVETPTLMSLLQPLLPTLSLPQSSGKGYDREEPKISPSSANFPSVAPPSPPAPSSTLPQPKTGTHEPCDAARHETEVGRDPSSELFDPPPRIDTTSKEVEVGDVSDGPVEVPSPPAPAVSPSPPSTPQLVLPVRLSSDLTEKPALIPRPQSLPSSPPNTAPRPPQYSGQSPSEAEISVNAHNSKVFRPFTRIQD